MKQVQDFLEHWQDQFPDNLKIKDHMKKLILTPVLDQVKLCVLTNQHAGKCGVWAKVDLDGNLLDLSASENVGAEMQRVVMQMLLKENHPKTIKMRNLGLNVKQMQVLVIQSDMQCKQDAQALEMVLASLLTPPLWWPDPEQWKLVADMF